MRLDSRQRSLILWGGWLLTTAVFFSVAGFYHRYYLATLAPALAACAGIGAVALWRWYRGGGWRSWALPLAIALTAAVQIRILRWDPTWSGRLVPLVAAGAAVTTLARAAARFSKPLRRYVRGWAIAGLSAVTLLAAPAVWATVTVLDGSGNANLPVAGPQERGGFGGFRGGPGGPESQVNSALIQYLEANRGNARYLVATNSAMNAAPIVIESGEPVMALGGFSGGDPIVTADDIARMVEAGVVRFFLAGGPGGIPDDAPAGAPPNAGAPGPMGGSVSAMSWVTSNCAPVSQSALQGASTGASTASDGLDGRTGFGATQLYDCAAMQG
jgi:4-amino-4-deoxy-L-arabinose transferase-like glycosyltransferase